MHATIWQAIIVTLSVSAQAIVLAVALAVPAAHAAGTLGRRSRRVLDVAATLPMVFPPTVVGFALLWLLGSNGPVGTLTQGGFGVSLLFTPTAAVLAASVAAFPLVYRSSRVAFAEVPADLKDAARSFGEGEWGVFFRVALPLARRGVLSGLMLGFARALGEFGATLMVAGNIPGRTQTLSLAIYNAVERNDETTALVLCAVAAGGGAAILWLVEGLQRKETP